MVWGDNVPKLLGQKPLRHLVKIVNVWQIVSFQYILLSVVNVLQYIVLANVLHQFEVVAKLCCVQRNSMRATA